MTMCEGERLPSHPSAWGERAVARDGWITAMAGSCAIPVTPDSY